MNLLILGLGNPGRQYDKTRHNVGFDFIDHIVKLYGVKLKRKTSLSAEIGSFCLEENKIFLVKPQTYMNRSGEVFPRIFKYTNTNIENLVVVCDNLDLPPGSIRLKGKGSSGGQKGLKSIINRLMTDHFCRLMVGVGRPQHQDDVILHVLSKANREDSQLIHKALEYASQSLVKLTHQNWEKIVHDINSY